jgi:hypothetical protein
MEVEDKRRFMPKELKELTPFQQELLKQEIDLIDRTISRIDHIQLTLRNWTVVIWGGSLFLIAEHLGKSGQLILLTAIIPFLFGMLDLIWTIQMLKVNFREERISEFINSGQGDDIFHFLDPIAKNYKHLPKYRNAITFGMAFTYKAQILFYLILIIISVVLSLSLLK